MREGSIVLSHRGQEHGAGMGTELSLGTDGSVSTREIPTHGDAWDWVTGMTPMISLEGQTARSFLEWVAWEQGWALKFESRDLARDAGAIRLSGEVHGMTLEQALETVLLSSRLQGRVEGGLLRVSGR